MTKPVVALDLDDMVFPFVEMLLPYYNQRAGTDLTLADYTTFNFEDIWKLTRTETVDIVHDFFFSLDEHPEPVPGSMEAVRELKNDFDLLIATARADELQQLTLQWIDTRFPDVFSGVHLCNLYIEARDTRRRKVDVCREFGAIALVDDSLDNVRQVAAAGMTGILFGSFPWNRYDELDPDVRHARDWDDVVAILSEFA